MLNMNDSLRMRWRELAPRMLPFADVASDDLPLSRILRLSLFQVSVGMALVLITGTLNRIMIVELGIAAWFVAFMVALPVLFAPLRALIGFRSDVHESAFGWRRVPFIWGADEDGRLHRLAVARDLVFACRDRLDYWRTLQELAGRRHLFRLPGSKNFDSL